MFYILLFIVLFMWLAFWSAQAGRSIRSVLVDGDEWQDNRDWYSLIPEVTIGLTIGGIGTWGFYSLSYAYDWGFLSIWLSPLLFLLLSSISYAGKQSATVHYLNWEGYSENVTEGRETTLRPWNDFVAKLFGVRFLSEGYSWIWAFTKGFITTLPVAALGCIFQPLGREMASHIPKFTPWGSKNFWMEFFGDGFGYSMAATLYILIINSFT